jgi:hypothetical protein
LAYTQNDDLVVRCNTSEANDFYFNNNPEAKKRREEFNKSISNKNLFFQKNNSETAFVIPVVFHVYGTDFNGKGVDDALIQQAIADVNKDFQGLNDDFNNVNELFLDKRGTLNITFKLAQIDPSGEATTGINYYEEASGYGNSSQIILNAWDNYKYMNVYIQNDLYDDGKTNNSGVAWFPDTEMSDNNTARVVYNGAYLATNTHKEFASTLTHEFGHWLNLYHTFRGGCDGTDEVDDTPREDGEHNNSCTPGTNCDDEYVNFENYMGYNGAKGCYKMFTQGQIDRMLATLEHPARKPLWQEENLVATGLKIASINNIAPLIEILTPENNQDFIENTGFTVTTSVSDPNGNSDINRVEFYYDNELISTQVFSPYELKFSNLEAGEHIIKAIVYDNGDLSNAQEIIINVNKKIFYPEVKWISTKPSYLENNSEFAVGETIRRIEITAFTETHEIIVKGPNNFSKTFTSILGEAVVIENASLGLWTVEIPEVKKIISYTFE